MVGVFYNLILYIFFDFFAEKIPASIQQSLKNYALVKALGEFVYCCVPYHCGDTKTFYKKLGVSDEKYNCIAAQNSSALGFFAKISLFITILYKSYKKFLSLTNRPESLKKLSEFRNNYGIYFKVYSIFALYVLKTRFHNEIIQELANIDPSLLKNEQAKQAAKNLSEIIKWVPESFFKPLII